jgi:hypothetical protein
MIVYEVTATVDGDLCDAYEEFMIGEHIPDVLSTGCFVSASIERSSSRMYRVRYNAETRQILDLYLDNHAPRLRADFQSHFPSGIQLSREEWELIGVFEP